MKWVGMRNMWFFLIWPNQQIKSLARVQCGEELDIEQNI